MKTQPKNIIKNQLFTNLDKFQSIDAEQDWSIVKGRIGFNKNRVGITFWRAAAIVVLILSIGFFANQYFQTPPSTMIAMTGENQQTIHLPDGSQVLLNKNTKLTYPEKFKRNNRLVNLTGEGFFEITRDPDKPFIVNVADRGNVEVLGTSFNIRATLLDEAVSVQVVEGSVAFYSHDAAAAQKILKKGDQAELLNGVITMNTDLDRNFLSWKTGVIYFDQDEITTVIDMLGRHYNREIILDNSVDKQLSFTSTIDNQEIESVLEELSLVMGISYSMDDKRILITGNE